MKVKKIPNLFHNIFAVISLGMTLSVDAADDEFEKNQNINVLENYMVIGTPSNIEELPGSAHIVTKEDIRQQNYDDISQALRKVPGVYVRQEDGFGLFPNISLRGVDTTRSAKITVMEDGVLTAPAPYSAPAAYYSPTVGRMSAIEILKGSSQVKYGPQTTGGVINYLSTPIPLQKTAYLKSSYGSFDDIRTHAYAGNTLTTSMGKIGILLEGYFRQNKGYKTIDETPDFQNGKNTGFTKFDPMIKLSWEPNTSVYQHFEFKYGSSELDANETYLGLSEADFAADPFRRYAATRFDNISSKQKRGYLRYTVSPTDNLDITMTLYNNDFSRNWYKLKDLRNVNGNTLKLAPALAGVQNGEGLACLKGDLSCTLRVRANNRKYNSKGIDSVAYYRFDTNEIQHEITAGIRFNMDRVRRFQWDDDYSQQANGIIDNKTTGIPGGAGNRLQKTDALALFLQDTIKVGAWSFTPGIRYENLDQTYVDYNDPSTSGTNNLDMLAGSLGVTYQFSNYWTGFASINRGFSPPSPKSAVAGIKEETSNAYELGLRYTNLEQALSVSAVGFYTQFNDLIVIDNIGGTGTGATENFGQVSSRGLEFSAQYDPGAANNWTYKNPWYFTATYTNAIQENDASSTDPESIFSYGKAGNKVPYIPELTFSVGTGIESENWGAHVNGSYVSETFTSANNVNDQVNGEGNPDARFGKTDSYFIMDISAYYRIKNGIKLFGGVQNLLDKNYISSRQPEGPRPGMPMFAYAGLELEF